MIKERHTNIRLLKLLFLQFPLLFSFHGPEYLQSSLQQQEIIWSKGAYRVSSRELLKELEKTQKEYRDIIDKKTISKRNYLEANINKDILAELEKIRRKKH